MESTLHRELKERYGADRGGRCEVVVEGFRVDAIEPDGTLVEVQSAGLGPLRRKLACLLGAHRVRVVKPVVISRAIVRRSRVEGPDLGSRISPKRGVVLDVFDDLVGLAGTFPHPSLSLDVLAVAIDEVRVPRRRRPGHAVVDRRLREIVGLTELRAAEDLWALLPAEPIGAFTTHDLAGLVGRTEAFARRLTYCLRVSGAAQVIGKRGNRLVYRRRDDAAGVGETAAGWPAGRSVGRSESSAGSGGGAGG